MSRAYEKKYPIVLGLCGIAGSGKTSTADVISPIGQYEIPGITKIDIVWDHKFFAMPLYEMVTVKTNIEGVERDQRILYGLHDICHNLMDQNIDYPDLVELVYDLYHVPANIEGSKARSFMQQAGSLCRKLDPGCFVDYTMRKIMVEHALYLKESYKRDEDNDPTPWGVVISDVRMPNEAERIKNQPNGILIKFTASQEVIDRRLMNRDGQLPSVVHRAHESETGVSAIPEEWFTHILNTDELTVKDQASVTQHIVKTELGLL